MYQTLIKRPKIVNYIIFIILTVVARRFPAFWEVKKCGNFTFKYLVILLEIIYKYTYWEQNVTYLFGVVLLNLYQALECW
jgi:hypothetical protein